MNKWLIAVISTSFLATTALADDDTESAVDSKWAFGLQAAPLIFGLSLRRQLTDKWYVQGLLQPTGDDVSVGARFLRTATKKKFWQSYLFAGLAHEQDSSPSAFFGSDTDSDFRETALTAGFGVEWSWHANNPSFPPLAWSLELGLGYSAEDFDDEFTDEVSEFFIAAGAGIHYQFE